MRVDGFPAAIYNHPAWIAWKESQGWNSLETGLGFSILLRSIGENYLMAYAVPLGFEGSGNVLISDAGATLERLSHRLLPFLPRTVAFIRWDLMAGPWRDSEGAVLDSRLQELRMNASTGLRRLRKSRIEHIDLETMLVDLRDGEAAILRAFDKSSLYSIRLAERRGTGVERSSEQELEEYYGLYMETTKRHKRHQEDFSYFKALFRSAQAWNLNLELYLARHSGTAVAAAIVAQCSDSSWYLFSASCEKKRSYAGPSAILAQALIDASVEGSSSMDLMGVAPAGLTKHPLSGVTRFKAGFGGQRMSRAGAWDYVVKPAAYARLP